MFRVVLLLAKYIGPLIMMGLFGHAGFSTLISLILTALGFQIPKLLLKIYIDDSNTPRIGYDYEFEI